MARPLRTKNIMRSPEEKEKIIFEFKKSGRRTLSFSKKKEIDSRLLMK